MTADTVDFVDLGEATGDNWNPDSTLGWNLDDVREDVEKKGLCRVVINDTSRDYSLPTLDTGYDINTIVQGDLVAQEISGRHHKLFVEGHIAPKTKFYHLTTMISAKHLGEKVNFENSAVQLAIVSDLNLSKKLAFARNLPCIVQVPEDKRFQIWCEFCGIETKQDPLGLHPSPTGFQTEEGVKHCLKELHRVGLLKGVEYPPCALSELDIKLPDIGR